MMMMMCYNKNDFQTLYNERQIQKNCDGRKHGKEFESAYLKCGKKQ